MLKLKKESEKTVVVAHYDCGCRERVRYYWVLRTFLDSFLQGFHYFQPEERDNNKLATHIFL